MSDPGATITLMRKDGRPLVTEFPVTARDRIEIIPPGEEPPLPDDLIACSFGPTLAERTAWMDDGIDPDDADQWTP